MPVASCHCGTVRLLLPRPPAYLNECQCSICRRYAVRWGYFHPDEVRVEAGEAGTACYVRDGGTLQFHRCPRCGCVTHWRAPGPGEDRIGVNARLMAPEDLHGVPLRITDGPPDGPECTGSSALRDPI